MTVSFDTDASAIESRFAAQFAAASFPVSPRPEVAYENVHFEPPEGQAWMRLTVLPAASTQRSMGAPSGALFEGVGLAVVEVYTPRGIGAGIGAAIADLVAGWYRGITADGVTYVGPLGEGPEVVRVGHDGRAFQTNVRIPWRSLRTA